MKIFTIDIGKGTQDIVVYDKEKGFENSIKMIFPSPSSILAEKVREINDDITFYGEIMGGAPLKFAIENHIKKGYNVYMTEKSALSIKDDIFSARKMGVTIVGDHEDGKSVRFETKDINMGLFEGIINALGMSIDDIESYGVSIQDHGYSPNKSNRAFRFEIYERIIENANFIVDNLFFKGDDIPSYFTRMHSALACLMTKMSPHTRHKIIFMDTSFAAVCGAYLYAQEIGLGDEILALNFGNAHTLAATITNRKICGFFEHHTRMLNKHKIENFLNQLMDNRLSNEEIYEDNGHGALVKEALEPEAIIVTGPKRSLIEETKLKFKYIYPCGDVITPSNYALIKILGR